MEAYAPLLDPCMSLAVSGLARILNMSPTRSRSRRIQILLVLQTDWLALLIAQMICREVRHGVNWKGKLELLRDLGDTLAEGPVGFHLRIRMRYEPHPVVLREAVTLTR